MFEALVSIYVLWLLYDVIYVFLIFCVLWITCAKMYLHDYVNVISYMCNMPI
jgi:hypothetical protein